MKGLTRCLIADPVLLFLKQKEDDLDAPQMIKVSGLAVQCTLPRLPHEAVRSNEGPGKIFHPFSPLRRESSLEREP